MKKILINLMTFDWFAMPVLFLNMLRVKFWEEWEREIPLHRRICIFFGVNDGSTFEMKGLYLLILVLGILWMMVMVPLNIWAYFLYTIAGILLLASGFAFIRTFIKKASWSKEDLEDGQD